MELMCESIRGVMVVVLAGAQLDASTAAEFSSVTLRQCWKHTLRSFST